MNTLPLGVVHTIIITPDGTALETDGHAEFHLEIDEIDGTPYLDLHVDVDFGALGRTLSINIPLAYTARLCALLHGVRSRTTNPAREGGRLRLIDP